MGLQVWRSVADQLPHVRCVLREPEAKNPEDERYSYVEHQGSDHHRGGLPERRRLPGRCLQFALEHVGETGRQEDDEEREAQEGSGHRLALGDSASAALLWRWRR